MGENNDARSAMAATDKLVNTSFCTSQIRPMRLQCCDVSSLDAQTALSTLLVRFLTVTVRVLVLIVMKIRWGNQSLHTKHHKDAESVMCDDLAKSEELEIFRRTSTSVHVMNQQKCDEEKSRQ